MKQTRVGIKLAWLAEMFQEDLSSVTRTAGYLEMLSDLDERDVLRAMDTCVKECKYFPRVAEIREIAARHRNDRKRIERQAQQRREIDEMRTPGIAAPAPIALPDPDAPRSNTGQPRSMKEILRAAAAKRKETSQ